MFFNPNFKQYLSLYLNSLEVEKYYCYMFLKVCCFIAILTFSFNSAILFAQQKIKGVTLVAPPNPFQSNIIQPLKDVGTNFVKVVPYGYTITNQPKVIYNSNRQWWGERKEGVLQTIQQIQKNGLATFLKPQVYIPGSWVGELDFDNEQDWQKWEQSYTEFILDYAKIAEDHNIELFCIGTEFRNSVNQRPQFWIDLIEKIKTVYCGKLTYCANWDNYEAIPFWNHLDYIGISAYFPLIEDKTPSVKKLKKAWTPIVKQLENFAAKQDITILFTEYGYLSVDGCAGKTWELEKKVHSLTINEQAQANALQALYEVFMEKDFWAGGFLWKWFPEMKGHEGYPEKDYTPQNKLAESIMKEHYSKK